MEYVLGFCAAAAAAFSVFSLTTIAREAVSAAAYYLKLEARLDVEGGSRRFPAALRIITNRVMKGRPAARLAKRMAEAGVGRPEEAAFLLIIAAAAVATLSVILLGPTPKTVVLIAVPALLIGAWLNKQAGDRLESFSEQLPQVFKSAAAALKAGASIQQALIHAADQSGPPAGDELAAVNEQIALGLPVDEALSGLYDRLPATELNLVLMGLSIQRRVGGNLVKLLNETTEAIEERRRLQRYLTIETAQARLSAKVIGLLPIVVTGLIAIIDPSFIAPLFTTPTGLIMVSLAGAAEAAGFFTLGRILEIGI